MRVGVPTEVKPDEYRVALTPAGARELTEHGHEVIVQAGAGEGSAIADGDYEAQGARIEADADAVFEQAELVLGVKEPQPEEVGLLRPEHTLFTYLHLAPAPELTRGLCESGATCVAYETVEDAHGRLPLLAPMSEVAGKIATQAGAFMLERPLGGRGGSQVCAGRHLARGPDGRGGALQRGEPGHAQADRSAPAGEGPGPRRHPGRGPLRHHHGRP